MHMPSLAPLGHRTLPISRPGPRFGEAPQVIEAKSPAQPPSVEKVEVKQKPQQSTTSPEQPPAKPNPFAAIADRISRFLKDLTKALNRLFGTEKPKPLLSAQLKGLKHTLKAKSLNEESLITLSDSMAQFNQKLEAPETQGKAMHALFELPNAVDRVTDKAFAKGPFAPANQTKPVLGAKIRSFVSIKKTEPEPKA